jgi:hypothetical protein
MLDYRSTLKFLAVFVGGAAVAGYLLSVSVPPAENRVPVSAEPATLSATNSPQSSPQPQPQQTAETQEPQPEQALGRRPVRIVPLQRPDNPEAIGPVLVELPEQAAAQTDGKPAQSAAQAPPKCDRDACSRAYRSFRETDCTYQPSRGPRKLCTRGERARNAFAQSSQTAAAPSCNRAACRRAFRSFDPATCTYKPHDGLRRRCGK